MGKKGIILLGQLGIILLVGTGCLLGNYRRNQAVATAGSLITKETERSTITEKTEAGLAAVMQEIIAERKATVVIDAGHGGALEVLTYVTGSNMHSGYFGKIIKQDFPLLRFVL